MVGGTVAKPTDPDARRVTVQGHHHDRPRDLPRLDHATPPVAPGRGCCGRPAGHHRPGHGRRPGPRGPDRTCPSRQLRPRRPRRNGLGGMRGHRQRHHHLRRPGPPGPGPRRLRSGRHGRTRWQGSHPVRSGGDWWSLRWQWGHRQHGRDRWRHRPSPPVHRPGRRSGFARGWLVNRRQRGPHPGRRHDHRHLARCRRRRRPGRLDAMWRGRGRLHLGGRRQWW